MIRLKHLAIYVLLLVIGLALAVVGITDTSIDDDDDDGVINGIDKCSDSNILLAVNPLDGCHENLILPQVESCMNPNTLLWNCAVDKPQYCILDGNEPKLVNNCVECGCSLELECQQDGTCAAPSFGKTDSSTTANQQSSESFVPSQDNSPTAASQDQQSSSPLAPAQSEPSVAAIDNQNTATTPSTAISAISRNECYDLDNREECESGACYWDTSYVDECVPSCSEISDTDCGRYQQCKLIETGSTFNPQMCVSPVEMRSIIHIGFALSQPVWVGEVIEGEHTKLSMGPMFDYATWAKTRDPSVMSCGSETTHDGITITWDCDEENEEGYPRLDLTIATIDDHQCNQDRVVLFSLGCEYGLCTVGDANTYKLIIHDNLRNC